ncbi:holin protein [[Clostridium] sordellii]|uniref:phage holin family protein n=1 Tax=Paraclostridium sordellii TaxID=1505 RepID=UPI0005420722|nr:phage holin family protein [Paeniclostridium sordellii]MCQ4696521.1 phage holin family protein [Paeniclostridium sordellii]MDU2148220.1 phage holin family protein [Paeniclostridium sordellii]MDU6482357.1 phage holin family protein [Paeniclostridium sordellii]CEK30249.1 holin protein [[Clostridium] sordellii] [Paeniclostridium sordellii]CEK34178.1 holin protein [[Clostridium] sordellii] [Paeniclostridium sordellii]
METIINFVPEQLLILVAALYVIGIFLKRTPKIKDWSIPWILLVLGISFSIPIMGFNATSILQGIICSFGAIATNQLVKQTVNK